MEQLWNAITAGATPLILSALAMLIPALATFALTWLKAQTALQEQAIRNAVDHVEAVKGPAVALSGTEAKRLAMRRVRQDVGPRALPAEKLSERIERVVAEKRRESQP